MPEPETHEVAIPVSTFAHDLAESMNITPYDAVLRLVAVGEATLRLDNAKYLAFQPAHEASQD